jgi:hypothetical protein
MEAVSDLHGIWSAACRAIRIEIAPVPGDYPDTGSCIQPRGDGIGGTIRQEINSSVPFEVAQDGAIAPPFRPGLVIYTEHLRSDSDRERHGAHEAQQRIVTCRHCEMKSETRAGFPAERHADPGEGSIECMAAPGTGGDERCGALGEGPSGTIGRATEEAASMDDESDGATAAREIGDAALIPAVDRLRGMMAERATCHSGNRLGNEGEVIALGAHMHDAQSTPVREESGKTHEEPPSRCDQRHEGV